MLTSLWLVITIAARIDPCGGPAEMKTIAVVDDRGSQIVAPMINDQQNRCVVYIPSSASSFTLRLTASGQDSVIGVRAKEGIIVQNASPHEAGAQWSGVIRVPAGVTTIAPVSLDLVTVPSAPTPGVIALANGTPSVKSVALTLYFARVPSLEIPAAKAECHPHMICLQASGPTTVVVSGENLAEVKSGTGAAYLKTDNKVVALDVDRAPQSLDVIVPSEEKDQSKTYALVMSTLNPYYDAATNKWIDTIRISNVRMEQPTSATHELVLNGAASLTLFATEPARSISVQVAGGDANALKAGDSYTIFEGAGQGRHAIASLDILDAQHARLTPTAVSTTPLRRDELTDEPVMTGSTVAYHTHLQVIATPHVDKTKIYHTIAAYTDSLVRPLERVRIEITGTSLSYYTPTVPLGFGTLVPDASDDHRLSLTLAVDSSVHTPIPLILKSQIVRDTTVDLPVAIPQRPRPFDYAVLYVKKPAYSPQLLHSFGPSRIENHPLDFRTRSVTRLNTLTLAAESPSISSNSLEGAVLRFNRFKIDSADLYGPQYVVVDVSFVGPDGTTIARDSVRTVLLPQSGMPYRLDNSFGQYDEVRFDEVLKGAMRYSTPGSYLSITIRDDAGHYAGMAPEAATFRLTNDSRVRWTPRLDLLTGLTYFDRQSSTKTTRTVVTNGLALDTLVHSTTTRDYSLDFLDVTGGASAAVDVDYLYADYRASLLRARVAFLAVLDPTRTDKKRRIGVGALYPIELFDIKGSVNLSLAIGHAWLFGGPGFYLLAPGVGFTLPKL